MPRSSTWVANLAFCKSPAWNGGASSAVWCSFTTGYASNTSAWNLRRSELFSALKFFSVGGFLNMSNPSSCLFWRDWDAFGLCALKPSGNNLEAHKRLHTGIMARMLRIIHSLTNNWTAVFLRLAHNHSSPVPTCVLAGTGTYPGMVTPVALALTDWHCNNLWPMFYPNIISTTILTPLEWAVNQRASDSTPPPFGVRSRPDRLHWIEFGEEDNVTRLIYIQWLSAYTLIKQTVLGCPK